MVAYIRLHHIDSVVQPSLYISVPYDNLSGLCRRLCWDVTQVPLAPITDGAEYHLPPLGMQYQASGNAQGAFGRYVFDHLAHVHCLGVHRLVLPVPLV